MMCVATNGFGAGSALIGRLPILNFQKKLSDELFAFRGEANIGDFTGVSKQVVDVLLMCVGQDNLSVDLVAKEMGVSARTLQRRLKRRGVRFVELRDVVRYSVSIELLVESQIKISDLANYLDFSDRNCFTAAFKRWTKFTPRQFRQRYRCRGKARSGLC